MRLLALVAACCAACALGGKRPDYHYYVLTAPAPSTPPRAGSGAESRTLAVDEVSIPGYLDRDEIATRSGQHLVYSPTDRWAEPLDRAFGRTLRENLAERLAPGGIEVTSRAGGATYELSVDVLRFERTAPDRVELRARWVLRSDMDVLDSGDTRIQLRTSGGDSNAMAAALSEAVARMAAEVGDRVERAGVVDRADRPPR